MADSLKNLALLAALAPLIGSIIAGVFGKKIGRSASHTVTIIGIAISFLSSLYIAKLIFMNDIPSFNGEVYVWATSGNFHFDVGFLVDRLTSVMMITVTFVSLLVHIYSIGYMADDSGYQRFFSYMSLFTFSMLILVLANNFMLLFFGWEAVGLVSYLLIGFWYEKESAAQGSLKAFLVNRAGDFGFILDIAAILDTFGSVDYATVFSHLPTASATTITILPGLHWSIITVICILLFIGAMGKSAQMPLHVWLPESMEGPTPISALIHAATMVTAGVYMLARMSPIFELSQAALSMVLIIGATGALFMGILGLIQTDIKRVIAYSTMSQLGYMVASAGASAYAGGIFHLITHAGFKALLFLAAGSVIIATHHEQDMRKMGGLRKYLPITYTTFLIGALALAAIPPFSGFFSKDAIIDAVAHSTISGADYAYLCLLLGAFVTALYTFRAFFLVFHTNERTDLEVRKHSREPRWVVTLPLILLAIPSVIIGWLLIKPMLSTTPGLLGNATYVLPQHNTLAELAAGFDSPMRMILHSMLTLPFWFSVVGIIVAWFCYIKVPKIPNVLQEKFNTLYQIMNYKYGFDAFNDWIFVRGGRALSEFFYKETDLKLIDNAMVDGLGGAVSWISQQARRLQTGHLYHYAFAMIIGLFVFLGWLLLKW